jgi:hypothetical protein
MSFRIRQVAHRSGFCPPALESCESPVDLIHGVGVGIKFAGYQSNSSVDGKE